MRLSVHTIVLAAVLLLAQQPAELDSDFQDSEVIVADTMNGLPLGEKQGPFKMVAPHDKRPARWVRMLKSLTVVSVAPPKS